MKSLFKTLTSLSSIRVLELEGLAPSSFCGQVLSDFGADVIQVVRPEPPIGIPDKNNILFSDTSFKSPLNYPFYSKKSRQKVDFLEF